MQLCIGAGGGQGGPKKLSSSLNPTHQSFVKQPTIPTYSIITFTDYVISTAPESSCMRKAKMGSINVTVACYKDCILVQILLISK